jgi:uridine phosphorylase
MGFGIGAPMAAILLEDFVASGVRRFVSIGIAGGLQDGMRTGDLVIAERAIRDEGTSYHYLPDAKYASASPDLTRRMIEVARQRSATCQVGAVWTTDAPYRETRAEIAQYRSEGVLAVDMEVAALFAVGERLGVEAGAAFAIADAIHEDGWRVGYDTQKARAGVETLFEAAVEVLAG